MADRLILGSCHSCLFRGFFSSPLLLVACITCTLHSLALRARLAYFTNATILGISVPLPPGRLATQHTRARAPALCLLIKITHSVCDSHGIGKLLVQRYRIPVTLGGKEGRCRLHRCLVPTCAGFKAVTLHMRVTFGSVMEDSGWSASSCVRGRQTRALGWRN